MCEEMRVSQPKVEIKRVEEERLRVTPGDLDAGHWPNGLFGIPGGLADNDQIIAGAKMVKGLKGL